MVELKSGETYNGMLVNCDAWMNVNLKDVIVTSPVVPSKFCFVLLIIIRRQAIDFGNYPSATFEV